MQLTKNFFIVTAAVLVGACAQDSGQEAQRIAPTQTQTQAQTSAQVQASSIWARATPPAAQAGAAYLQLHNSGAEADRLVALEAPVSGRVELHTMVTRDGVMVMRKIDHLELPAGEDVVMAPGGNHIMLMELTRPLVEGDVFPLTLKFEHASPVVVSVPVASMGAMEPPAVDREENP